VGCLLYARHVGQYLRRMVARVDFVVNAGNLSGLVDEETDAICVTRIGIVARTVGHPKRAIGVAQQRKVEIVFLRERGVVLDAVKARPQHHDSIVLEIFLLSAEPAAFDRSARGVSFGVKPQQNFAAAQTRKRKLVAFMGGQSKIGRNVTNFWHHRSILRASSITGRAGAVKEGLAR
jgi:hypothetical protein